MVTSVDIESAILDVVGAGKFAQPGFYPDEKPEPPYVNFMPYEYDLIFASNQTWIWRVSYDVVLCTTYRTPALEKALVDALRAHGVSIRDVQATADFDERTYYFEVFTESVTETFE